jgi:hypothetical protein
MRIQIVQIYHGFHPTKVGHRSIYANRTKDTPKRLGAFPLYHMAQKGGWCVSRLYCHVRWFYPIRFGHSSILFVLIEFKSCKIKSLFLVRLVFLFFVAQNQLFWSFPSFWFFFSWSDAHFLGQMFLGRIFWVTLNQFKVHMSYVPRIKYVQI